MTVNPVAATWLAIAVALVLASVRGIWLAVRSYRIANTWPDTVEKRELRLVAIGHLVREVVRLLTGVGYAAIGVPPLYGDARWTTTTTVLVWSAAGMLFLSIADQLIKARIMRLAREAGQVAE